MDDALKLHELGDLQWPQVATGFLCSRFVILRILRALCCSHEDMRSQQASDPPPELDGNVGIRDENDYETGRLGREFAEKKKNQQ